jgi:hypothetical protein
MSAGRRAIVANLGTLSVVGARAAVADLLGVALWHELGCADADTRLRRRLQIA